MSDKTEKTIFTLPGGPHQISNPLAPGSIVFGHSPAVLTITAEGRVVPGDGFTPTEAGIAAIDAMDGYLKQKFDKAREDGIKAGRAEFQAFGLEIRDGALFINGYAVHVDPRDVKP